MALAIISEQKKRNKDIKEVKDKSMDFPILNIINILVSFS